jgi:hypothetical protein
VKVFSAFSGESVSSFRLPSSRQVLEVKRCAQAAQGIGIFCQRLLLRPAGRSLRDHEVLATLPGLPPGTRDARLYMQLYLLVLALMGLEDVDADVRAAGRLLLAAREGRAHALQQLLSLPMWPGYRDESGTRLGIASVGTAPVMLASRAGHLEVVRLLCDAGARRGQGATGLRRGLDVWRLSTDAWRWCVCGEEPRYGGVSISDVLAQELGVGGVLSLLWFRRQLPVAGTKFLEMILLGGRGPRPGGERRAQHHRHGARWRVVMIEKRGGNLCAPRPAAPGLLRLPERLVRGAV